MPLVADASVAFKWFVPEVDREAAMALLDDDEPLCAPDLIFAEVGNAMWARLRETPGGMSATDNAQLALRRILGRVVPASDYVRRAIEIAFELKHPIYDCIYLAVCEREDLQLVTADERLAKRLAGTRHSPLLKDWR